MRKSVTSVVAVADRSGDVPDHRRGTAGRLVRHVQAAQACFNDVFERVRAEYVEEMTDQELIEAAIERR
jgi:hypothetical protein